MSREITIITNNVPRPILYEYELTLTERKEFDYLDWTAFENGEASHQFFRYQGQVYDLDEFQTTRTLPEFNPLYQWHGYLSDSFFSGIVVRWADDENIIVGRFVA